MRCLAFALLGGCLISEPREGQWAPLDHACVPVAAQPSPIVRDAALHDFVVAGDTIVFDTADGIAQHLVRTGAEATIAHVGLLTTQEFHVVGNDLVYYDWPVVGGRDIVRDRGADADPRYERLASLSADSIFVIAIPAGLYWRYTDDRGRWARWSPATGFVTEFELGTTRSVFTDGREFFYKSGADLETLAVDGGAATTVAAVDAKTLPLGIADGRLFTWHTETGDLDEVSRTGARRLVAAVEHVGPASNYGFGGGYFYWAPIEDGPDHLYRLALADGAIETVAGVPDDAIIAALEVDACNAYWRVIRDGAPTEVWARGH